MSSDSSSSIYTTPDQHHQRFPDALSVSENKEWLLCNDFSPFMASRVPNEEQDENVVKSWNVAKSHFRRRNWLDTRLAELQKDVASLTLKFHFNDNYEMMLDVSSVLATSKEQENELESSKTSGRVEKRRKEIKEQLSGAARAGNRTLKVLKQLHNVTIERDELKVELERTKRALAAAEKKCEDAEKNKAAHDKLKAYCDSLQESLDLSKRIRVKQKKLLQHLQERAAKKEGQMMKSTAEMKMRRQELKTQQTSSARGTPFTIYDAVDAVVASDDPQDKDENTGLDVHEQASSESTAASRSRKSRLMLKPTTSIAEQPGFDSLLQSSVTQFGTRLSGPMVTNNTQRTSQTQAQQREAMRQAARSAESRGAAVDISTSTTQKATRKILTTARPQTSFLTPTQASLRRLRNLPRRNYERPPFVV